MQASTAAPEPVTVPITTRDDGRSPASPLDLRPTPSQLARAERAAVHGGVASRGLRFRLREEAAEEPGVAGAESPIELTPAP